MDIALIENAENQVYDDQCRNDQHRHARQRRLECLRITLECADGRPRHVYVASGLRNGINGLTECNARSDVEGQGDRWELALMRYLERSNCARIDIDQIG